MRKLIFIVTLLSVQTSLVFGQTADSPTNIPIVSNAPISYRVNESGNILHGYYKKGYNLTIYGDEFAIGFRADCDRNNDWSRPNGSGATQPRNNFEAEFDCVFDPHRLYGTVLPGNSSGQNHFDKLKNQKVGVGDLTITYNLDNNNQLRDSIIGVVYSTCPQNQPGESSVATCDEMNMSFYENRSIYIVFPNTAKYVRAHIGTIPNTNKLKRNPTNRDFESAYRLMIGDVTFRKKTKMQRNLVRLLLQIPILSNFDSATEQEMAAGKLRQKNNDLNLNE